jgi:hypothetical protein
LARVNARTFLECGEVAAFVFSFRRENGITKRKNKSGNRAALQKRYNIFRPSRKATAMKRSTLLLSLVVLGAALAGFGAIVLAGDSTELILVGGLLLVGAAGGGLVLGLSALWRSGSEPTTLARQDGPVLTSKKQNQAQWRDIGLSALIGAVVTALIAVFFLDSPDLPLAGKIIGGACVGIVCGPLVRYLPPISW